MKRRALRNLVVWKASDELSRRLIEFVALAEVKRYPGLQAKLERVAVALIDNIETGFEKGTTKDLIAFLGIARASAHDVASMLSALEDWSIFSSLRAEVSGLRNESQNILRQLNGWIENLSSIESAAVRILSAKSRNGYPIKHGRRAFWETIDHINRLEAEKQIATKK